MQSPSDESLDAMLESARRLHAAGDLAGAEAGYRRVLEIQPWHAVALNMMAALAIHCGRADLGAELAGRAVGIDSKYAEGYLHLGAALSSLGRVAEAETALRRAIGLKPGVAEAHFNLGVLCARRGDQDQAEACYRRAIEIRPGFAEALTNLSAILAERRNWVEAAEFYSRMVEVAPRAGNLYMLGRLLQKAGRLAEAADVCQRAVAGQPRSLDARVLQVSVLVACERVEDARGAIRDGLGMFPESAVLRFYESALTDGAVPTAPEEFVTALFNDYAGGFDEHLVGRLRYRGHEYLARAVAALFPERCFDVLDLGCGTGLCGVEIRGMARRLVGVDVAGAMIEASRRRGIYDDLWQMDVVAAMREHGAGFDLMLAGDLFIYVGDLELVFAAAAAVLPAGGMLAYTAEKQEAAGFRLQPTFRYAHSLEYLRETAGRHGLREVYLREEVLRIESGVPLAAWIVVVRKDGK